jgi:hypothetical protein
MGYVVLWYMNMYVCILYVLYMYIYICVWTLSDSPTPYYIPHHANPTIPLCTTQPPIQINQTTQTTTPIYTHTQKARPRQCRRARFGGPQQEAPAGDCWADHAAVHPWAAAAAGVRGFTFVCMYICVCICVYGYSFHEILHVPA